MRESERRQRARERAEAEELRAGAVELRRLAASDSYAGVRGRDVADCLAASLEGLALDWATLRPQVRADLLTAVRKMATGPDGPNDPRRNRSALSDGPGH